MNTHSANAPTGGQRTVSPWIPPESGAETCLFSGQAFKRTNKDPAYSSEKKKTHAHFLKYGKSIPYYWWQWKMLQEDSGSDSEIRSPNKLLIGPHK